jgi:hypothetical protein
MAFIWQIYRSAPALARRPTDPEGSAKKLILFLLPSYHGSSAEKLSEYSSCGLATDQHDVILSLSRTAI